MDKTKRFMDGFWSIFKKDMTVLKYKNSTPTKVK